MSFFGGFLKKGKQEEKLNKWLRQKENIKQSMDELDLPSWLAEWVMLIIEREEILRGQTEVAEWIQKDWLEKEEIPEDFNDETMLLKIYNYYNDWVEEHVELHVDVRRSDYDSFEALIAERGEYIRSMEKDAQKTYLAIWGEVLNVISQGMSI